MRVLVACEFSGTVRDAFIARGHEAWSCDLLESERPGPHIRRDVREVIGNGRGWDLMVAFPPCTYLASSGARWFEARKREQAEALDFVRFLMGAPIPAIAIENPVGVISSRIRKPDQIIQPFQFGHPETKTTCLWLSGLWPLTHTEVVEPDYMKRADGTYYTDRKGKRYSRVHYLSGRMKDDVRWKARSRTYPGIAKAMAEQWGSPDWHSILAPVNRAAALEAGLR